jgi:hypothetical protein
MHDCKGSRKALAIWQTWTIFVKNLVFFLMLDNFGENFKLRYPHIYTIHKHLVRKQPLETSIHKSVVPCKGIEPQSKKYFTTQLQWKVDL